MFSRFTSKRALLSTASIVSATAAASGFILYNEDPVTVVDYNWDHNSKLSAFDHASLRRGFQVYKQVCSTCHSLQYIPFRSLVNVIMTEKEAKALAASYEIEDGPNDEGEMFQRPGKLSDYFPSPYKNEQEGRMANGGAYPPDLSLMTKARTNGLDYVFALLTGYTSAPYGKTVTPGLHYNPYFPGGAIAMSKQLEDGQIEYEDGTPATVSQMAKDVATFLNWTAEPEHDDRKKFGFQAIIVLSALAILLGYNKRFLWSSYKTAQSSVIKRRKH
jgi:ubiquinol-cytochrome c reductase cytochrome c1 subunit